MAAATERPPATLDDLTPEWLTLALHEAGAVPRDRRVTSVSTELIGDGRGFVGQVARVRLQYDGAAGDAPRSLIAKLPSAEPKERALNEAAGLYDREVRFYQQLAPRLSLRSPRCYFSHRDPGPSDEAIDRLLARLERMPGWQLALWFWLLSWNARRSRRRFVLLLEDLSPRTTQHSQLQGAGLELGAAALRALADAHAQSWNAEVPPELRWVRALRETRNMTVIATRRSFAAFRRIQTGRLSAHTFTLAEWLVENGMAFALSLDERPETFCHGDFRLDNLFFDQNGAELGVVAADWQTSFRGLPAYDVAYFISGSLVDATSEQDVEHLLRVYHEALCKRGVQGYDFDALVADYARGLMLMVQWVINLSEAAARRDDRDLDALVQVWCGRLDERLRVVQPSSLLG
ncbi:MAG: phosphotransferase [Polyangiales bacterium]